MRVAIPLFGNRVAPRCLNSESMLLANIENGAVNSRSIHHTAELNPREWTEFLLELGIEVVVCGALSREFQQELKALGITAITNVAGEAEEVLGQLELGKLIPGYGLSGAKSAGPHGKSGDILKGIDCARCIERVCLHGGKCVPTVDKLNPPENDEELRKTLEAAADVALEKDRKLCRVAELVHYCLGMEYQHLGVAFCVEMFREAETLVAVLRRFFEVSSVCCKVGGITPEEIHLPAGPNDLVCNAVGQAVFLNMKGAELNVLAGLCVGCDTVFSQYSQAPVTTLFVKDKMLANNPVGAIYSKYYLEDLAQEL